MHLNLTAVTSDSSYEQYLIQNIWQQAQHLQRDRATAEWVSSG